MRCPPIRYAIYTRQSVEKLADFSSCQAQFQTCQDFVTALNDPRLQWCGQHFDDEGQLGRARPLKRPLRQIICAHPCSSGAEMSGQGPSRSW